MFFNCAMASELSRAAFVNITDKAVQNDRQLMLEHGKPLLFGKDNDKGIRIKPDFTPEVVQVGDGPDQVPLSEIAVHDERSPTPGYAFMLAHLDLPEFPVPIGIMRAVDKPSYSEMSAAQIQAAREKAGQGDLHKLIYSGTTWDVD